MYSKLKLSILPVTCLLLSCMVGPDYRRPPLAVPDKFKEAQGNAFLVANSRDWKIAEPADACERGKWWLLFHDSQLNELESQLNRHNQNIAKAVANYYQSLAIVDEARASLFPNLAGAFNLLRQKSGGGSTSFSSNSGGVITTGTASTGTSVSRSAITSTYSALLNANWEPDIWGQVRRTIEADRAAARANQALLAVTRLSAQGSLAQYYFELRTLDSIQLLLNATVNNYKKALRLTRNQYASGIVSQADILQAESLLETTQAQAINNGILRSQYEHAIAVLIGRPPADFYIPLAPLTASPPKIPVTIPTIWLERRPDIAEAERLIQQANALIGVAVAAYYPTLNLSGAASAAGNSFHRLIHKPGIGWSYGLQLAETFFDGGLRNATVRAAKAAWMAQVAAYRQTVLVAFQDVEDNLVNLRLLKEQVWLRNLAAANAKKALRLVTNQYKAGIVPYSNVLTAQITAFTAEINARQVAGLQMTAAVGLIKSLGGGWEARI